jgi:hypothetical protein
VFELFLTETLLVDQQVQSVNEREALIGANLLQLVLWRGVHVIQFQLAQLPKGLCTHDGLRV